MCIRDSQLGSKDAVNQPQPTAAPMNYTFFKVNPNCLDPLFAVAVNSEISTAHVNIQNRCV